MSAISGFNLPDDGRGMALTDWDRDGDLDVWISNRNGPQLRFLRNQAVGKNRFVAIRLQGVTCNRDAIGARLELHLRGKSSARLIRTLRAGDGFLSQSAKWIHFGLGRNETIDHLSVRWPGGQVQTVRHLEADRWYHVVQGHRTAQAWTPPQRQVKINQSASATPASTESSATRCFSLLHFPQLDIETVDGQRQALGTDDSLPALVILWASWCPSCLVELSEIAKHEHNIRASGMRVIALSVDLIATEKENSREQALSAVERIKFPFPVGFADDALLDKLQILNDTMFDLHRPLPVPTSYLLDAKGRVAGVYKGRVDLQRILDDRVKLASTGLQWRQRSVPFPGRWIAPMRSLHPFPMINRFARRGHIDAALQYLAIHEKAMASHPQWPDLAFHIGRTYQMRGDEGDALKFFERALLSDSGHVESLIQVAMITAASPNAGSRDGVRARTASNLAARLTDYQNAFALHALAAALAEVGEYKNAVKFAMDGLQLAEQAGQAKLIKSLRHCLELYRKGKPYRHNQ